MHMKSLHLSKPHLLVVVGIPGSGKTFFASQFADTFNIPFIHYSDLQMLRDPELSEEETASIAGVLFRELVKTEQTILIDGPGASRVERAALAQQARASGYQPLFIWVQTEQPTAKARAVRGVRGSNYQTISEEVFMAEAKRFTPLNPAEKSIVISGKHTYASQAKMVLKRLVGPAIEARKATPVITNVRPAQKPSGRIAIR
jgi:adenylate kinase family enzyme